MGNSSQRNGMDDDSRATADDTGSKGAPNTGTASGRGRFDLKAWIKKNPQGARIGGGAAVLAVLLLLLWFFVLSGESDTQKTARPSTSTPSKDALAQLGMDDQDDHDDQDDDVPPDSEDSAPDRSDPDPPDEEEPEPEVPPLPEDVSVWKSEDFERARREGDPKLLEAVGHLGGSSVHDEAVVPMLTGLLRPFKPDEPVDEKEPVAPKAAHTPGTTTDVAKLADAVVAALAVNDTEAARAVLEQVISGELGAEADETRVVDAALKALVERPSSGNEELLFRLLTASEHFRKPSGTDAAVAPRRAGKGAPRQLLSAEGLRARVLGLLKETASVGFRAKLAAFLVQPTTPLAWRAEMGGFLLEPDADNLGAQFVMYQAGRLEEEVRTRIEEHFARRSTQAMQAVLQIPRELQESRAGTGRGSAAARSKGAAGRTVPAAAKEDPELPFRLARQLWGERSTEAFTQRLADVDHRESPGHLLALCATMPVETVRTALLETLTARHGFGPDALQKAGVPGVLVSDPGFLLVVKSLDRQEPQAQAPAGRAGGRGQPRAPAGRTADGAGQQWMKFSEALVRSWCERLDAAALAQAENARLAGKNPADLRRLGDLPIELHENADIRSAYHLVLPGSSADELSGARVGPMRIQYVRTEERTSAKRLVGYYQRILRIREGRLMDDGVWFDTYRSAEAPGVRCSLDVLVRLADKKTARDVDPDADENLVVEVLSIEAREP